jgi:hypothetical protein
LPAPARAKHAALKALAEDSAALVATALERGKGLDELIYTLDMRLSRLDPSTEADDIRHVTEERDAARTAMQDLMRQRDRRSGMKANAEQCLAQLEGFVVALVDGRVGSSGIRPVKVDPELRDGETLAKAITRLRNAVAQANGEIARLLQAPLTPAEIKDRVRAQVDKMANAGRPTLMLDGGKVDIQFPDENRFGDGALSAPTKSASSLMAWMFHDEILDRMLDGVDQIQGGVPMAERADREAEIRKRILALEHEEEALVVRALADGLEVHRRPSASGFALLGIEPVPVPEFEAA